jgi:hypothetical protein
MDASERTVAVRRIEAIVTTIVARNRVAEDGRRLLMLAEEFPVAGLTERRQEATVPLFISGVCTVDPTLWAFACYGRKVERAYMMRREGHRVQIVSERDFWDAIHV